MASVAKAVDAGRARPREDAVADALDDAARVLLRHAARLRAAPGPATDARATDRRSAAPAGLRRVRGLGGRQAAVLGLGGMATTEGLTAQDVARALDYSAPNATNILKRLEELGHLQRVPGERPARWRARQS